MNATEEIPQQINDLIKVASSIRDEFVMNGAGTDSKSDTPLTHSKSGFVLEDTRRDRRDLIAMRERYGADTPIGHRCSNIIGQLESHHRCTTISELRTQLPTLTASIKKQMAELKALTLNAEHHQSPQGE